MSDWHYIKIDPEITPYSKVSGAGQEYLRNGNEYVLARDVDIFSVKGSDWPLATMRFEKEENEK